MPVKTTVQEVRDAYRAFKRISEEVRLPQKPAWRIGRLLNRLKPVVVDFEETQLQLYRGAGGYENGRGVEIKVPIREEGEDPVVFMERQRDHEAAVARLAEEIRALSGEEVEIDYDPIPLSLLQDDATTKPDKRRQFSPNDFADAGVFIVDDEVKE